ncbi:hypothetical protein [Streptomyces sp. ME19-01-6]|uniref:hypothetical protein n=1 Tax=Streptomyces sp. ME19-01-6 TaxID=3028686 RepID=UPI0029AB8282|nr:hypothetical protein [Streptomyces sp. ME19-01-6]MDX3230826.1 hypothetical protein [Streptomyces sp. ME19-01-6]
MEIDFPGPGAGPPAFARALRAADWNAFEPERDLPPLRSALAEWERVHGVTEAHRIATEHVRKRALLRHPDVHRVGITAQALSPSGRYLAVGDFGGEDYEAGATLQIWEVPTGRCVNVIDRIVGGIGWPGYDEMLEWSADETRLAVEYQASNVGVWDPFGADTEPIATVRLTCNGRPDPFALSPDGLRAYVMDETSETYGSIVEFSSLETTTVPAVNDEEEEEEEEDEDEEEDESFVLDRPVWSRDGTRVYGNLHDGRVCSIDVASGQVSWLTEADRISRWPSAEWSRDERLVAYHRGGALVIADALTGRPVAETPGYRDESYLSLFMSWGPRLAVVVPASSHADTPRVGIVDPTGEHRYDLDVAVREPAPDLDARTWAWEPDGDRAACLTVGDRIEIWSLGEERGERLHAFAAPKGAAGVLWGADGVLVALGQKILRFLRADSGEVIGDFTLLRQPPAPRPLAIEGEDWGEDMYPEPNPTFALDEETWAVAFPIGVVIAPPGREEDLGATLTWAVDRRFAWPVHWGGLDVVPDAPAAAERVPEPLREYLEPFRGRTMPASGPRGWPPPNTATVDDLFQAFLKAVAEYGNVQNPWSGEALHGAALIRARRGEPDGARWLIEACPKGRRAYLAAEAAMILAGAGLPDDARSLFSDHEAACESLGEEALWDAMMWGSRARALGAVGGACAALGEQERADRWFDRARAAIRAEGGSWEHRLPVVWAQMECGRDAQARALLDEGTGDPGHVAGVPFLGYVLRKGRADLAEAILRCANNWFGSHSVVRLLAEHGRPRLLRDWADRENLWVEDDLRVAERNAAGGRPDLPGDDDVQRLGRRYEEVARIPPAKRRGPTADLIRQAAECRHLSAVLDLLPAVPMPSHGGISSDDRPYVAFSALRIATTGVDAETW